MLFRSDRYLIHTDRIGAVERIDGQRHDAADNPIEGVLVTFTGGGKKFVPDPAGRELYEFLLDEERERAQEIPY